MGLKTTCSNCGKSFAMKNRDKEFKKVTCRNCGKPFVVTFDSDSGGAGGGMAAGLPPKVVGQKPPRPAKPQGEAPAPKQTPGGTGMTKIFVIAGSIVGLLVAWTGIMFAVGSSGGNTKPETPEVVELEFTRQRSEQGRFGVDCPVGWEFKTGGGSGGKPEFVRLNADGITVSIKTDLEASLHGDIQGAGAPPDEELPEELEPIARVHEIMKKDMLIDMDPYEEQPPEKVMGGFGNSRISEFEGDRGVMNGRWAYGYRATLPAGTDKIKVVAKCDSQELFEKYKDSLRRIILSVGPN